MTNEHWMAEVEQPMSGSRRLLIVGVVVLVLIGAWAVFAYVENKKTERNYQDLMAEVQETYSAYLVENYEGIEAIEWQGVGVEFLASDLIGRSNFGPVVATEGRVYVNKTDYFPLDISMSLVAEYDFDAEEYVLNGPLTPKNMDGDISFELGNKLDDLSPSDRRVFDGFVKSDQGSPDTEVMYNVDIFKFDWA